MKTKKAQILEIAEQLKDIFEDNLLFNDHVSITFEISDEGDVKISAYSFERHTIDIDELEDDDE